MTLKELGKRAVACKHWRWMPGMLFRDALGAYWRMNEIRNGVELWCGRECIDTRDEAVTPEFGDPATLGCLLALVREAHGDDSLHVSSVDYGPAGIRWVVARTRNHVRQHDTEAEALVCALEAASTA